MDFNKKDEHKDSQRLLVLVILVLVANALIVMLLFRYHRFALRESEAQHEFARSIKEGEVANLKEEIRLLEGAPTWEETQLAIFFHQ